MRNEIFVPGGGGNDRAMTDILSPLRDIQISAIIALVFFHDFLEGELDKYDDPCHSQASKAVL